MDSTPITIKDIARDLQVSVSTVSRALKDNKSISLELRQKIKEYAQAHRYQPNIMATRLRSSFRGRTDLIGVIIPEFVHHYFSCVLTGIEECCAKNGYRMVVATSHDSYEREKKIVESFRQAQVRGIIVSLAKDTQEYSHFEEAQKDGIPLVFYDRICTELRTSRVVVDDYQGAYTATEHLIKMGCKRICFCTAPMNLEISKNRLNGYKDALQKLGLKYDAQMVVPCDNRAKAEEMIPEVMRTQQPDGFFTTNDDTAIGVLYSVKSMGIRVPEEVQICGFSNGVRAVCCEPQLTTVEQHGTLLGEKAALALIDQLEGRIPQGKYRNQIVKTALVVRGTTKEK